MSGQDALDYALAFVVGCMGVCLLCSAVCLVGMTIGAWRNKHD